MITDSFGRVHDYLRISLTDNCNFRCFYCMPEEDYDFTPPTKLMQADEIIKLAEIFVSQGIRKIRLTGGEPLVRKDAAAIISALGKLPVELVITTNGTRLSELLPILKRAGVQKLNISLDTLIAEKFLMITRRDVFQTVKDNIELMLRENIAVKINMVVMKDLNESEIIDFIEWTKNEPIQIRFIEFMPFCGNKWTSNKVISMKEILDLIQQNYKVIPLVSGPHDTAKSFEIPGHSGSFAIISTMTVPFCSSCNRLRLTADGKLKNCLFSDNETDLLSALRNQQEILPLIQACVRDKKKELGGQILPDFEIIDADTIKNRSMIAIGG